MSLILHIVRTDARRFAIPIALWIAITIAGAGMEGIGPRPRLIGGAARHSSSRC